MTEEQTPNRILPILRTQRADTQSLRLLEQLSEVFGQVPAVACDNRTGDFDGPAPRYLPLNAKTLTDYGVTDPPDNWGWLCGDFCYYAAIHRYPGYDLYLLVENDVFMDDAGARLLSERLTRTKAQAIAARLRHQPEVPAPRYSRPLRKIGYDAHVGCLFPLTAASPSLIRAMRAVRLKALAKNAAINDEAAFSTAVFETGVAFQTLETLLTPHISEEHLRTNPPYLLEAVERDPETPLFRHPAIPLALVLERIRTGERNYHARRLREILGTANSAELQHIETALRTRAAHVQDHG
ncbi:MAG: hypothetical protein AAFX00_00570 [Pseudomonadota bacterium]